MNLFAAPVVVGAALVSAPALWGAFVDGTTTTETAVTRYLVSAMLLWVAFGVVGMLVGPAPRPVLDAEADTLVQAAVDDGEQPAG